MVYRSCVTSAMLYESETWCLRENEMAIFENDLESNSESNVWCKADGEKENKRPDGVVRIEGNSGSDGKGQLSEMVRTCAEEG